jgi:signal transduction histidine kinase
LFFWIIGFAALLIYSYFSIQVVRGKSRILLQHQTTLENQNEALTKANKELDYFFYAVSHDLRSPLTSVLGLIELMKMENDPTQINNYLSLQESSIKKMNDFIFDIIHIAKNARQELEVDSISFNSIIQDIIAQHEFNDDSQQIEKIVTVDQKNEFFGDATRLKIVLNNLISNAIHYSNLTQEKSIIKISVVTNLNEAIIKIWDNGIGIPKEFQQKVFDMFFRGNNEKPGTGLGLYMVHEIIHKMNGTIELKSELNHFTEFILHIPQKK